MRECPECARCYSDETLRCPADDERLVFGFAGEPLLKERYLLERRIGTGGMGKVYKARHLFLRTDHAIKVILNNVGEDPELVRRFRQEAVATAAIRHPNIIAVTDFDVINNEVPFLVMEYVKGRALDSIIAEDGVLPLPRVLEIMEALCRGVEAAHSLGILHRDLKPLNILLQDNTPVSLGLKILDFGLAKIRQEDMFGSLMLARTRGMIGSPYYMAPEQWSEEEPDVHTDIYALGVILYQMLAGGVPFKGPSLMSVMKQHLFKPPPMLDLAGRQFPAGLEKVMQRALAKEREHRPHSVTELWREIDAAARPELLATQYAMRRVEPAPPPEPTPVPPPVAPDPIAPSQEQSFSWRDAPTEMEYGAEVLEDEPQSAPTVLENVADLLESGVEVIPTSRESLPPAPAVAPLPEPPLPAPKIAVAPPPPVEKMADEPFDGEETLVHGAVTNAHSLARPIKITLSDVGGESDPNWPARMTGPVVEARPPSAQLNVPVKPGLAKRMPLAAWLALGAVVLLGAVGLGMGLSRWLASSTASENQYASPVVSNKAERLKVLDYYVQVKNGPKVSGAEPLKKGQEIKLHFVSQQSGYLYLLGHQDAKRETHLTQNPAYAQIGLSSNKLGEKADFSFPGADIWLVLKAEKIDYTVIFSPQPLSRYSFLTANGIRDLSAAELGELETLRQHAAAQGDIAEVEPQEGRNSVTLATHNILSDKDQRLVIFEISLRFL